ncbi:ABC transporter permease [Aquisphaera insulae]|uniref:ABC transporter permease n=1 Tax=Aquisphaera insulae TaxID=2712864 RepID=UPI0013EE2C9A|nr:FtsX-like permease family protein [Aquisphaera insulae]
MKFLGLIVRNARRNPTRSLLTVASLAVSLFLGMLILSYLSINDDVISSVRVHNRLVTMSSFGFSGRLPISRVAEITALDGIVASTPFVWFGGKFRGRANAFPQYAVDPAVAFSIFDELTVPSYQIEALRQDRTGCVVGRLLAEDLGLEVGDRLPLQAGAYPVEVILTIRGIYDGPANRNRRMCVFRWDCLDEALKRTTPARSGNAGIILSKCRGAGDQARLALAIDGLFANSDSPSRTQSEEEFGRMFSESMGDVRGMIRNVGLAVVFSLLCVAGNSMAMSVRERAGEMAVMKAIGFSRAMIVYLVVGEATILAVAGGLIGTVGCKLLCGVLDVARLSGGSIPFFFVRWPTVALGLGVAVFIGLASGLLPALRAARLSVIDGLRRVG